MLFTRLPSTSRDLLRLVVWLAVLQAIVQAAAPTSRPPRRRGLGHPGTRDLDRDRPAPVPDPTAPRGLTVSQSACAAGADRPHRARRGRRAPSARRRGCRGGGGWYGERETKSNSRLLGHLNIQSLKPKILELSTELSKFKYDLLTLNETWLRPSTPNRLLVSVLGLPLGQGAEWKIQTESQHKEWKNMTQ